jgi:Putative MetA-pathway of phenol degradation
MWRARCRTFIPALLLLASLARIDAQATTDDVPTANPARPTVASPATLTPVAYLQFENGLLYSEDSLEFSSLVEITQVTKLTVHPRLQLLVASAPLVHSGLGTDNEVNVGDVLAGAQVVLLPGERHRPTIAASYLGRVYASSGADLDIGTPQHALILLASGDVKGFHFDANAFFNELTQNNVGRAQYGQTISISHPIKKFTVAGELWHFTQPFINGNAVGNLWAVSYTVRPNLVIDAGFNHGLTSTSTQWVAVAGFTYLLPHRLWKKK